MKNEGLYLRMKSDVLLRMTGLIVILILHSSFFISHAEAQTFTDRLRQYEDGRGKVTITQSAEIEDLVNNAVLTPQQHPTTPQPQQTAPHTQQQTPQQYVPSTQNTTTTPTQPTKTNTAQQPSTTKAQQNNDQNTDDEVTTPDTSKKVMRGGHKVQGFRVQVFSGGNSRNDRQKAERIGAAMKSHFPDQPVYVHFYSPSWKCRIGNYRTQEEARTILTQVKQLGYTSACIVKGTITVQ